MKLNENIKRIFDALAYANAGELMTTQKKLQLLDGCSTLAVTAPDPVATRQPRSQAGLYLGSELPEDMMQYAMQTCSRLKYGLTVLTLRSEEEAQSLLAPYRSELELAGIDLHLIALVGEPISSLAHALRRHPEITFLICNESGYLGNGLQAGRVRQDVLPTPIVLVTSNHASVLDKQVPTKTTRSA